MVVNIIMPLYYYTFPGPMFTDETQSLVVVVVVVIVARIPTTWFS